MVQTASSSMRLRLVVTAIFLIALVVAGLTFSGGASKAQVSGPVLVSDSVSTRAIAVESINHTREPFSLTPPVSFSSDDRTRITLFAMRLYMASGETASAVTASAEDVNHNTYSLPVESVLAVPRQPWLTAVTVRLADGMDGLGDVLVGITHQGSSSNRVRVALGYVGGGPADDAGAVPTPAADPIITVAAPAPTPNTNPITAGILSTDDVRTVISQAVSAAMALNVKATVAVTDREGNVLGLFHMTGTEKQTILITGGGKFGEGLEGVNVLPATLAAISKAGTASFFSTFGDAFTTRTAGFIIQEHFPPAIKFQSSGPLYGVQFSSLPCTDVKAPATLPLGLSADPGSFPLYKNGVPSGAVGIESDGIYTIDRNPTIGDFKTPEEAIAVAAGRGYEPPDLIRGDNILVNGIRLPFVNATLADVPQTATIPFANLSGSLDPLFPTIRGAQPSEFIPQTIGGVNGTVDTRFFPFKDGVSPSDHPLTAGEVNTIISQAAQQADITRAAIRQPLGSAARVNITVVDRDGNILGIFRTFDAPVFGFDVSAQKGRTAAFNSNPIAGTMYRAVGLGSYADRAAADGIKFDGSIAFSDRAGGFLHRPFFPDGIDGTAAGPLSRPLGEFSVFNVGLQLDLILGLPTFFSQDGVNLIPTGILSQQPSIGNLLPAILNYPAITPPCANIPNVANGIQIFPGSVPLYRNGELIGAIGISGDGVDQDDIIAAAGSFGFAAPPQIRADQVIVRGTRLPYVKFPRSPDL